jgi:hypothetical protein
MCCVNLDFEQQIGATDFALHDVDRKLGQVSSAYEFVPQADIFNGGSTR